jgi:hypothetical protein
MRWTRQRFARDGIAGWVGERPVSDQQRADEGCCSVRRSRVVLTPRRWRQARGGCVGPTGLRQNHIRWATVAKQPGHRGARRKPLKPLRAGMPGDSGVLVVARVRSITTSAHGAAGATGTRRSPRPPGRKIYQRLGRIARRGRERMLELERRHCEERLVRRSSTSEGGSDEAIQTPSFRDGPQDQTSDVQLHIGESRDSGFDASHRLGMTGSGSRLLREDAIRRAFARPGMTALN